MERHSDRLKPIANPIETKNNNYLVLHLTFVRWPFLCTGVRKEIILFLFLAVQSHSTDCERRENYYFSSDCRNALECVHCASGNYLIVALNKVAAAKKSNIFNWNYFNIFASTAQPARYRGCCCCHSFLRWPPFLSILFFELRIFLNSLRCFENETTVHVRISRTENHTQSNQWQTYDYYEWRVVDTTVRRRMEKWIEWNNHNWHCLILRSTGVSSETENGSVCARFAKCDQNVGIKSVFPPRTATNSWILHEMNWNSSWLFSRNLDLYK